MARRAHQPLSVVERVNVLLLKAWEHGARHVSLEPQGEGLQISFLGPDGREHSEQFPLAYQDMVERLREMGAQLGRVHMDMAGHQWQFDAVVPSAPCPDRVFIHMRPTSD